MNNRNNRSIVLQFQLAPIWLSLSLLFAVPATAHHAMGGRLPANGIEGFLSGLAHPVIGLDHFAFVVAIGLLAATKRHGFWIPIAFLLAALAGTSIHLLRLNLPAPELMIAVSVLLFGVMLALKNSPSVVVISGLAAVAGLFHGYAYGEAIVGAEMASLTAYLLGFTLIQWIVAMIAWRLGKRALSQLSDSPALPLRFAGFVLCGAGAVFLSTVVIQ